MGKNNVFDRIKEFYFGDKKFQLTEKEHQISLRWEFAHMKLFQMYPKHLVANHLIREFKVNASTAYRDIHNAIKLFGELPETPRVNSEILEIINKKTKNIKSIDQEEKAMVVIPLKEWKHLVDSVDEIKSGYKNGLDDYMTKQQIMEKFEFGEASWLRYKRQGLFTVKKLGGIQIVKVQDIIDAIEKSN